VNQSVIPYASGSFSTESTHSCHGGNRPVADKGSGVKTHPMSEQVYGPIIMVCVTLLFGWLLVSGFRHGKMEWGYFGLTLSGRREDQPVRFWAVAGCLTMITIMMFLGTLAAIFIPQGI
jgi:hypothetical protein